MMLELGQVDLQDLASALEDQSDFHSWWLDPRSGAIELWSEDVLDEDEDRPADRDAVAIEPIASREGWLDMADFIEQIGDARARDLLARAIEGRGAFRRFKDTLLEFPDLREAWFDFHRIRMERRAIEWLLDQHLIDAGAGRRAVDARPDPEISHGVDALAVARAVEADLADRYRERLREVRLYGSWARGDAHPESDIDLLVVLDQLDSRWAERRRIEDILWKHSLENDVVVSAFPVGEEELEQSSSPLLARISSDAVAVT
jgi:predicted nucleotidyltransferase